MSGKRVILDADILSMFAKVDAIEVLGEFLGRGRVGMTPAKLYLCKLSCEGCG